MSRGMITDHLADFRNKFGALHQTYTPNKERELYSRPLLAMLGLIANELSSSLHIRDGHETDGDDHIDGARHHHQGQPAEYATRIDGGDDTAHLFIVDLWMVGRRGGYPHEARFPLGALPSGIHRGIRRSSPTRYPLVYMFLVPLYAPSSTC